MAQSVYAMEPLDDLTFLSSGGEISSLIKTFKWSNTPLGPIKTWSQSLKIALQIALASKFPMQILWGEEYIQFYNDAYIPIAGNKHPHGIGQRGMDCWQEVWDFVSPLLDQVMATGEATWAEDQRLVLNRNGQEEEGYFTFSYSPIRDETGKVGGIFIAVNETTQKVLGERQERALRAEAEVAKENLENVLASISDEFMMFDSNWCFTYVNHRAAASLQKSSQKLLGQYIWELFPDTLETPFYQKLHQAVDTQTATSFEQFCPVTNRWLEHRVYPFGKAVSLLRVDITARKVAEMRLQELTSELQVLYDQAPCGYHAIDIDGVFVQINETELRMLGYKRDEILGKHFSDFIAPECISTYQTNFPQFIQRGWVKDLEFHMIRKDGSILPVSISATAVRDEEGNFMMTRSIMMDISDRKRIERALQASQNQLNTILNTAPASISLCRFFPNRTYITDYHSVGCEALTGYAPEEITSELWVTRTFQADWDAMSTAVFDAVFQEEPITIEYRFRHKDGSVRWIEDHLTSRRDAEQDCWVVTMVGIDITARKQSEAALHESEEQIRNILESINDGFFALNEDWQFTYVNQAGERILDRTPNDLIGKNIWEEYPGLYDTEFERIYREAMQDRRDGSATAFYPEHHRWYAVHAYPAVVGITVYFRDITAQKQAEEAVRQSEARYRYLVESVPQLVWIADAQGCNTYVSQQMCDYIGLPADQLLSLNWQTVIHPDDVEGIGRRWMKSVQSGIPYEAEYRLRRADGVYRWQLVRATPFQNEQGQVTQWFGVSTDIHEKQELEQQRSQLLQQAQAAQEAAERANRIKDEFLAILSHELRSPLNPILGWTKLLQTRKLDAAKTSAALATIERNARLQTQLIDDLLDIAKILQGKLSMNVTPVDLGTVIEAAIDTVRSAAIAKNISLHSALSQTGQASGDASRLQQIIWNLLSNAIKFTPPNGRVEICLEFVEQQAKIIVSDTGKGIKPDFLPHIFDSFRQEDVSITRQFGGLGLGLSIVKHLVDAHGGAIVASSPGEGQGATFTVSLPLLKDEAILPATSPLPVVGVELSGIKVLAVDDSEDTRELLSTLLSGYGAEAKVAASGEEVLAILNHFEPDVLVCDISMPNMDGYKLLQQVRALTAESKKDIPAIALTAFAREEDYQRSLNHGFQKHIAKPLDPNTLAMAIAELVTK